VRLYLVQHGQAMSEQEDPERPLTEAGTAEVAAVADRALERGGVRASRILHSGKTRARQTAEAWAARLGASVEPADGLAPNDDAALWAERLAAVTEDVMLVGHLPHLGRLSALLITGRAEPAVVAFRPGCVVGLEVAEGRWVITLVLPPDAG
jgi:phosphohistidine phosphatase